MSAIFTITPPTTIPVIHRPNNALRQMLRSKVSAAFGGKKVVYINEFPYTRKYTMKDVLANWRTDGERYPKFDPGLHFFAPCYMLQDKETGIIYNYFVHKILDVGEVTERDIKCMDKEILPRWKQDEDELPFRILGESWGYAHPSWQESEDNEKYRITLGDQFPALFEEKDIYFYFSDPIYEYDIDDDDKEMMKADYQNKHQEYWEEWNYTDKNLGVK